MDRSVTLRDKGILVEALWGAVNDTSGTLSTVAPLIKRVLETGAWQRRTHEDGHEYTNRTFLEFITRNPPAGCRWEPKSVEALIRDDPEVLTMWRKATTNEMGTNQYSGKGADNVSTLKPQWGNSRKDTLDRLKGERPDLYRRVVAKELSANAAAIEAGWRKKQTPLELLQKAWKKASPEERQSFLKEITP